MPAVVWPFQDAPFRDRLRYVYKIWRQIPLPPRGISAAKTLRGSALPKTQSPSHHQPQSVESPTGQKLDPGLNMRDTAGQTTATQDAARHEAEAESQKQPHAHLDFWVRHSRWPEFLFTPQQGTMVSNLVRKRSDSSTSWSRDEDVMPLPSTTSNDQGSRKVKITRYDDQRYLAQLESLSVFMETKSWEPAVNESSRIMCGQLLDREQEVPSHTRFDDAQFKDTISWLHSQTEGRVSCIRELIVPTAEELAFRGAENLRLLRESSNEGWNAVIPLTQPRPQPDYAVGFRKSAFTPDQFRKLSVLTGDFCSVSYYRATDSCYFPFLACEVKSGVAGLEVADRQNMHSMSVAVRGVVELYRLVKRETELDREILAFSFSHDNMMVRVYGHYPVIDGRNTSYRRHQIGMFCFGSADGRLRWTSYKFVKNIYDVWMPNHLKRICSAIDDLPKNVSFNVSDLSATHDSARSTGQTSKRSSMGSRRPVGSRRKASTTKSGQSLGPKTSEQLESRGPAKKKRRISVAS